MVKLASKKNIEIVEFGHAVSAFTQGFLNF